MINIQLAKDFDERNSAGTGLVLPADDIMSGRIRRVPPPLPPRKVRTAQQSDLEAFKAWRTIKVGECFKSWNDRECICVPLVDDSARGGVSPPRAGA
eukprot:4414241-Alexandrium_andersonii.AAC.1